MVLRGLIARSGPATSTVIHPNWGYRRGYRWIGQKVTPNVSPPLLPVVVRLCRAVLERRVAPPHPIAGDEDYPTQDARPLAVCSQTAAGQRIIDAGLAMALRKERRQPLHLLVFQPEKVAHHHPRQSGSLHRAARTASSRLTGPDPRSRLGQGVRKVFGARHRCASSRSRCRCNSDEY